MWETVEVGTCPPGKPPFPLQGKQCPWLRPVKAPLRGTKSLLGEGQSNNFLELICGKWRPMGARVGDSTQPAPSTIGESITRQTGVTRKQRSLLGCEKHLLKLLLPLRTVSCLIFPKYREPQVSGKGQEFVFLWHATMPATHSEWSWGLTGTSLCVCSSIRKGQGERQATTTGLSGLYRIELNPAPAQVKQREKSFVQSEEKPDTPH